MGTNSDAGSARCPKSSFYLNGWLVDPGECTLTEPGTGKKQKITPRAMSVLVHLADHAGEVVSAEELLEEIWHNSYIAPNAVQKTISEIRHALAEDPRLPNILLTVPKRGYKLLATPLSPERTPPHVAPEWTSAPAWFWSRQRVGIGAAVALTISIIVFALHPWRLPEGVESGQMQVFANGKGDRLGLLVPDSPGDSSELLASLRHSATVEMTLLGYREDAVLTVSSAEPLARIVHENGLSRAMRISWSGNGALLEAFPFIDKLVFRRTFSSDSSLQSARLVLKTILSTEDVARMTRWGTHDPDAYLLAREAVVAQRRANLDSMLEAKPLLQKAIAIDPGFASAYGELGCLLADIVRLTANLRTTESSRQELLDLIDQAEINDVSQDIRESLRRKVAYLSLDSPIQFEQRLSERLAANPSDSDALFQYSGLLAGVGFADEAIAYATRSAESLSPEEGGRLIAIRLGDVWAATDRSKANAAVLKHLENAPNDPVALFGMISRLAQAGNLADSERYLERLRISDKEGAWAYSAEVNLKAIRGDYTQHPEMLQADLESPLMTNMMRGRVQFMLGNVDAGIDAWRNLEPSLRWLIWRFPAVRDLDFPKEVVEHPKYQTFMDDLGVGPRWRSYLRGRVESLASVTGVPASTELPRSEVGLLASR